MRFPDGVDDPVASFGQAYRQALPNAQLFGAVESPRFDIHHKFSQSCKDAPSRADERNKSKGLLFRARSGHKRSYWLLLIEDVIRTSEGFAYLAVVIDLYSRRVIGWAMQSRQTTDVVLQAPLVAVWRRKQKDKVLIHSD
jgi:hypothetical protein